MKKITSALLLLIALALPAMAQRNITSLIPVALIEPATTNLTPSEAIGWNVDQVLVFQLAITTTNVAHATTRSNVVIRFDTSVNQTDWVTNQYSLNAAPGGTASVANSTITRLTNSVGAKWIRVGATENVNTNRVWFNRFHVQ